jgi:serine/threonine-protein kinase HipA
MRQAAIYLDGQRTGLLIQDEQGFTFVYDAAYVTQAGAEPVSLTLPLRAEPYVERVLFPFFDGLIPEGWLLDIAEHNWKLNPRDRMGLLLACCQDCIGAVSVNPLVSSPFDYA